VAEVEAEGGWVELDAADDEGVVFVVAVPDCELEVPVAPADEAIPERTELAPVGETVPFPTPPVLAAAWPPEAAVPLALAPAILVDEPDVEDDLTRTGGGGSSVTGRMNSAFCFMEERK
jgi:hypothetical protein